MGSNQLPSTTPSVMGDQAAPADQNGGLYGALAGAWNYAATSISRCHILCVMHSSAGCRLHLETAWAQA